MTTQSSGITANNFTSPVTYTVTAADSTTQDYVVTVTVALSPAKDITAFSFKSVNNPGIGVDTTGTITGTAIAVTLAPGTAVSALVATFSTTGSSVAVGSTTQTSDITANDFSNPVAYTVTAADGTTKVYTVTVTFYNAHCATNSQWMPVTCSGAGWVWSTNRAFLTVAGASAAHVLASGCQHSNIDSRCSLDGTGWVSTQTHSMSGCNTSWSHLITNGSYGCANHDGDIVRYQASGPDDCYPY